VTQCIRVHDVESLIQACNMGILGSGRFTTKISVGSRFTTSFGGISSLDGGWIDVHFNMSRCGIPFAVQPCINRLKFALSVGKTLTLESF